MLPINFFLLLTQLLRLAFGGFFCRPSRRFRLLGFAPGAYFGYPLLFLCFKPGVFCGVFLCGFLARVGLCRPGADCPALVDLPWLAFKDVMIHAAFKRLLIFSFLFGLRCRCGLGLGGRWCPGCNDRDGLLHCDFLQLRYCTQFAQFGKVISGCLAIKVTAQDDGFAGKETFHAFGVVDTKEFGKSGSDPLRIFARQDFALEREVEFVHLAPDSPISFMSSPRQMYGVSACFTSDAEGD